MQARAVTATPNLNQSIGFGNQVTADSLTRHAYAKVIEN